MTAQPWNLSSELPLLVPKLQCLPRHLTLRWVCRTCVVEGFHRPKLRPDALCSPLEVVDASSPTIGRYTSLPAGSQGSSTWVKVPVRVQLLPLQKSEHKWSWRCKARNKEQCYLDGSLEMMAGTLKAAAITAELSHGHVLSLNKLFCALVTRPFQPSQPSISQPVQASTLLCAT